MKGRGGRVRSSGHEHDFCRAKKAENTHPPRITLKTVTSLNKESRLSNFHFS